jgi:hypothetical protein
VLTIDNGNGRPAVFESLDEEHRLTEYGGII